MEPGEIILAAMMQSHLEYREWLLRQAEDLSKDFWKWRKIEINQCKGASRQGENVKYLAHMLLFKVVEVEGRAPTLWLYWARYHRKKSMAKGLIDRINKGKGFKYNMKILLAGLKPVLWKNRIAGYELAASEIRKAWDQNEKSLKATKALMINTGAFLDYKVFCGGSI